MNGFKLLCITPFASCDVEYRKNLKEGNPIIFYQDYEVTINEDKTEILSISRIKQPSASDRLFNLDNGIKLNISAVVGKNGSGKSTIFELLYYLIYVLGTSMKINGKSILENSTIDLENRIKSHIRDYNFLSDLLTPNEKSEWLGEDLNIGKNSYPKYSNLEIAFKLNNKYHVNLATKNFKDLETILDVIRKEIFDKYITLTAQLRIEKQSDNRLRKYLGVSVIYEIDDEFHEIIFQNNQFKYKSFSTKKTITSIDEFNFETFFYNVSLNYSHHGLNSKTMGNWITKLFHKNDAYRTPVAINPMRTDGNFDVNRELKLSKERLMSNLIYDLVKKPDFLLLEKYTISKFQFTPKIRASSRLLLGYDQEFFKSLNSHPLLKEYVGIQRIEDNFPFWDIALSYLEEKIEKIKTHYKFVFSDKDYTNIDFLDFLRTEDSHITKKVRQTLNFLKYTKDHKADSIWKMLPNRMVSELNIDELLRWLSICEVEMVETMPAELIEFALPGFFDIDFLLEDKKGETFIFSKLSSGEQQVILNTNSILYHLYNLNSIHKNKSSLNPENSSIQDKRIHYDNVNIILDEMELYYHPQMQKAFIKNLKDSFELIKRKNESGLKSINVCILTHSPFILSDIPSNNILRINEGEPIKEKVKSFSGNIHDILADDFFLKNGSIGDFAKEKIDQLISWLNYKSLLNEISNLKNQEGDVNIALNKEILSRKIFEEKVWRKNIVPLTSEYCYSLIEIIDEPLLKSTLEEMYNQIYPDKENSTLDKIKTYAKSLGRDDLAEKL